MKIYNPPDIMKSVLRKDPVKGDIRPVVPIETTDGKLRVPYEDVIHKGILSKPSKEGNHVMIRFISNRNLGLIKTNFTDLSHFRDYDNSKTGANICLCKKTNYFSNFR